MAKLVEAADVERVVRKYLGKSGHSLSSPKKYGQTGVDIIATHEKHTCFVEIIGFQSHAPTRSREFYEAFFRIISRDRNNPHDILVLALPKRFKNGMRQREQHYPIAWDKLGKAFPNLKLWYVDTEKGSIEEYQWANPY